MAPSAEEELAKVDQIIDDPISSAEEKLGRLRVLRSPKTHSRSLSSHATNGHSRLGPDETLELLTSNLQETLNKEIIEDVVRNKDRPLRIYWGTAPTGRPHCGYFVPMLKIAEFLRAGANVKILLADIHAFLDNLKAPIELVKFRAGYYKYIVIELMNALGVPTEKLEFVLGSSYQTSENYQMDLLRSCTEVSMHDARKAGSEVVKQVEDVKLSGLIYPLMQALDEEYLGVDAQFGGVDQRKIFTLAKDLLPKLKYAQRAHMMNPMVAGLGAGGKMSASDPNSKIDVLEKPEVVRKKLSKAYCEPREIKDNGVMALVEYTLLPASALRLGRPRFEVERREGEPLVYSSIDQMHNDYKTDVLTPQLLKNAVTKSLNTLLEPIQTAFMKSTEWQHIADQAYPSEETWKVKPKKDKEKKNKGSRYPGAANGNVETQEDGTVEGKDKEQVELASSATEALTELKVEEKMLNNK